MFPIWARSSKNFIMLLFPNTRKNADFLLADWAETLSLLSVCVAPYPSKRHCLPVWSVQQPPEWSLHCLPSFHFHTQPGWPFKSIHPIMSASCLKSLTADHGSLNIVKSNWRGEKNWKFYTDKWFSKCNAMVAFKKYLRT